MVLFKLLSLTSLNSKMKSKLGIIIYSIITLVLVLWLLTS